MELKEIQYGESCRIITDTIGYWVYSNNTRYLDISLGNSAFAWGYKNKSIIDTLQNSFNDVNYIRGRMNETCDIVEKVNTKLTSITGMHDVLWALSGSDAVEAALEIAYQWHSAIDKKYKVLSFKPNYHGCTSMPKALRNERKWSEYVSIIRAPKWKKMEDREAAEEVALKNINTILDSDSNIGTIIIESVAWIAGFFPQTNNWWNKLRKICDERSILLIIDDVAGGFGKVHPIASHLQFKIEPDIVCFGKAISGGYAPIGCALAHKKLRDVLYTRRWYHGHTWQPYVPGIHVINKILEMINEEKFFNLSKRKNLWIKGLYEDGLIEYDRSIGCIGELIAGLKILPEKMDKAQLITNQLYKETLCFAVPQIADEEYWYELNLRVRKLLTSCSVNTVPVPWKFSTT